MITHDEISEVLLTRKGQFASVTWERNVKLLKRFAGLMPIVKRCSLVVRAGITYDNLSAVIDKRASGELPPVNAGLPWGEWELYPYYIQHNGVRYVRLYPFQGAQVRVTYTQGGNLVNPGTVQMVSVASEFARKPTPDCFTVHEDYIVSLR